MLLQGISYLSTKVKPDDYCDLRGVCGVFLRFLDADRISLIQVSFSLNPINLPSS